MKGLEASQIAKHNSAIQTPLKGADGPKSDNPRHDNVLEFMEIRNHLLKIPWGLSSLV